VIRVLGPSDFVIQPWANGRGETVELARKGDSGGFLWRISVATVAEDGPFSRFPGIWRSLTVIEGPGFRILGDGVDVRAEPLMPVDFPGDAAVAASEVAAISRDFNVMVAGGGPGAVTVHEGAGRLDVPGAVYALDPVTVGGTAVPVGHLALTDAPEGVQGGRWIGVRLPV
jgi:environmental stress-induced protein Ves